MLNVSKYKFLFILLYEILLMPALYLYNYYKSKGHNRQIRYRKRRSTADNIIEVFIHEWGGYPLTRFKNVHRLPSFECGLLYQLLRFQKERDGLLINVNVTISEIDKYRPQELLKIESLSNKVIPVSNKGMDFSGYAEAHKILSKLPNRYVVLTNSSINKIQNEFLSGYIKLLNSDLTIGAIGISFNTKYNCSLIKNNFNPHIQSFFVLTTSEVLDEIVQYNNGHFPGVGITDKYLLIRMGEVKLSQIIMKLNYKLVTVLENGTIFEFDKNTPLYKFPFKDFRRSCNCPNTIYPLKNLKNQLI